MEASMDTLISGELRIDTPRVLDSPTTMRGEPGATIVGHARDALLVVRSRVVLEGLTLRRVDRPDGSPSWGSLVVVEEGGALELRDCKLEGAAHGYLVEPETTLLATEAWTHAGLDVRERGRAVARDCVFEGCSIGASASIYPKAEEVDLELQDCTFRGCATALRVTAAAQADVQRCAATGPGAVAYEFSGSSLKLHRCDATGFDQAVVAKSGRLRVSRGTWSDCRVGLISEGDADVRAHTTRIKASTGAGVVAKGRSGVHLRDVRVEGSSGNGLEAVEAATLHAKRGTVDAAKAALLAMDAGQLTLDGTTLGGTPEWAAYADAVAQVDPADAALPPGKVEARGLARAGETQGPGIDLDGWTDLLTTRADWRPELRRATGPRWRAAGAPEALVAAWVEAGGPGVHAHAAFTGRDHRPAPVLLGPPRRLARLSGAIVALEALPEGCLAATARGTIAVVGPDGTKARGRAPRDCQALVVGPSMVAALAGRSAYSIRTVRLFDLDLDELGEHTPHSPISALRLADPVELIWTDDTGHPTDRCAGRTVWSPPAPPSEPVIVGHAGFIPSEPWTWRQKRGGAQANVARLGSYTALLHEGALQVTPPAGRPVVHLSLPHATTLAGATDASTLYIGTSAGDILALSVTLAE